MGSMKRKADTPLDGKKPLKKKSKNGWSNELQERPLGLQVTDFVQLQRSQKKKRSHASAKVSLTKRC
jgi:hypothetical protein